MSAVIEDDRTPEQKQTHRVLVLGTDSFMSGWGQARNGASYAAWACTSADAHKVLAWVESRSEMKRVRVVGSDYRPGRYCAHLHIYVVKEGHRALEA
jgi:hypothetical protein